MVKKLIAKRLTARLRWFYRNVDTPPILDLARYFPAHQDLLSAYPALRDEALAVFRQNPNIPRFHDILSTQARISAGDGKNWRMFMVRSYAYDIKDNMAKTPVLAAFLKANPQVTTAAISFLDPGKHIPRHRGPFRGILRYHLCLFAPDCGTEKGPWLVVGDTKIPYSEGEDLLWDDTAPHEVLNPSPEPRIALLLDIKRPVTSITHRILFRMMMIGGWLHSVRKARIMRGTAPIAQTDLPS